MDGVPVAEPTAEPAVEPPAVSSSSPEGLSTRDRSILAFERLWWKHAGAKEQAIRAEFGLSAARYYQLLGVVIDSPLAVAHDPMLVKRLQRMRDARSQARADRSLRSTDRPRTAP